MTLGFLGTGAITSAMVTGLNTPDASPYTILLSPRNAEVAAGLAHRFPRVSAAAANQQVVDESDTVIIAVRPQIAEQVLAGLSFRADHQILSLVSGFSIGKLAGLVAPAVRIARAVPLPSAARRRSPTAIFPRNRTAEELFALLGAAFAVDTESAFDALCTVTASMATYFALAGAAASWLARHGIPPGQARQYVAGIFAGLAQAALEKPESSFQSLAADHATRGGTNEQVWRQMAAHGVFEAFSEALDGILRRVTSGVTP